jgi:hypothetical protein
MAKTTVQQGLVDFLYTNLNKQTGFLPEDKVVFDNGWMIHKRGNKFKYRTFANYFTEIVTDKIPTMMQPENQPQPIPNLDIAGWSISVVMALKAKNRDDEHFQKELFAVETFRKSLLGFSDVITINDGTIFPKDYNFGFNCSDISQDQSVSIINGQDRVLVSFTIFAISSLGGVVGNQVTYRMGLKGNSPQPLFVFDRKQDMVKTPTPSQKINATLTKSLYSAKKWIGTYSFFYDNSTFQQTILDEINDDVTVNTVYDWVIEYPHKPFTKEVIISKATDVPAIGNITIITMELEESDL